MGGIVFEECESPGEDLPPAFVAIERKPEDDPALVQFFKTRSPLKAKFKRRGAHVKAEAREFVAWDGEGTRSEGKAQPYVLFGCNLPDMYICKPEISTVEMFDLMLKVGHTYPQRIHVGFAFDYDANQIMKDLPRIKLARIKEYGKVHWYTRDKWGNKRHFRIDYKPHKWFQITGEYAGQELTVRIFDVFTFFGTSFVKALRSWVPENHPDIDEIESGKEKRDEFTFEQIKYIEDYWRKELVWLVKLAEKLRENFYQVGFRIVRWHGPGALADYIYKQRGIFPHMARVEITEAEQKRGIRNTLPFEVNEAAQFALTAGRFELFQCGNYEGKVYGYDLNSAYPTAIAKLPSLEGTWVHIENPTEPEEFAIYRIRRQPDLPKKAAYLMPHPLFSRTKKNTVVYPPAVEGWFWAPEAALVWGSKGTEVLEGWVLRDSKHKPFDWVPEMYAQRKAWEDSDDPMLKTLAKSIKLGLNSFYGKMIQSVGFDGGNNAPPTLHQLEWGGWVTSWTRAQMFLAIMQAVRLNCLVSIETDGIYTTKPLKLDVGKGLGQWKDDVYEGITYLQNGLYWLNEEGEWKAKIRGLDKDSITREQALAYMREPNPFEVKEGRGIKARTTRFISFGRALYLNEDIWRHWRTDPRVIWLGGGDGGKRIHLKENCGACTAGISPADGLHNLSVNPDYAFELNQAHKYRLPWVSGMTEEQRTAAFEEWSLYMEDKWDILYA